MLVRTVLPVEGQFALTDSNRVFSQETRIDLQIEFPYIVASAFCRFRIGVRARRGEVDSRVVVRTPCIRNFGVADAYGVTLVERLTHMHEYLDDTVATAYGAQVLYDGLALEVVASVVADAGLLRAAVHMANDRVAVRLQHGQTQYKDRIYLLASLRPYGVHVRTAGHVVLAAPGIYIAITYRELDGIEVGLRRSGYQPDSDLVDTVATKLRGVSIAVQTVGADLQAVPVEYLALYDSSRVVLVEAAGLVQVDAYDRVATRSGNQRVIYYGRLRVGVALPGRLAAERHGADRTFCRQYGQYQLVDTVVARSRLVCIEVMLVVADLATQVGQSVPCEIVALTDRQRLYEMIRTLIFGQHQSPEVATAGLAVRTLILIGTRLVEDLGLLRTVVHIGPGESVLAAQRSVGLIDLQRVLLDVDAHKGVATQHVIVVAGLGIGLAVIYHVLVAADGEVHIYLLQFTNGQVQTVVDEVARGLLLRIGEYAVLAGSYAVPLQRLARADGSHRVDGIHVVDRQDQHLRRVATEAVLRRIVVNAGLVINLVVPGIALALVDVADILDGVGIQHVERENHHRVATRVVERMGIDAALGQGLVGKGIAGASADGARDTRLRDIFYGQVQNVLYAIHAVGIRLGLYVTVRLLVHMAAP